MILAPGSPAPDAPNYAEVVRYIAAILVAIGVVVGILIRGVLLEIRDSLLALEDGEA
jgi:hypothetical protein